MRTDTLTFLKVLIPASALSLILPLCASAGAITFFDAAGTITSTDDTSRVPLPCIGVSGGCSIILEAPIGFSSIDGTSIVSIAEPSGARVSDVITLLNLNPDQFQILFDEAGGSAPCPALGCNLVEDGTIQTAATVTWIGSGAPVVDMIRFQADVNDVPEPLTGFLTFAGLSIMAAVVRNRRLRSSDPA